MHYLLEADYIHAMVLISDLYAEFTYLCYVHVSVQHPFLQLDLRALHQLQHFFSSGVQFTLTCGLIIYMMCILLLYHGTRHVVVSRSCDLKMIITFIM